MAGRYLIGALVAAGAAGLVWLLLVSSTPGAAHAKSEASSRTQTRASAAFPEQVTLASAPSETPSQQRPAPAADEQSPLRQFNDASSYRAFIANALKGDGRALLYAWVTLAECRAHGEKTRHAAPAGVAAVQARAILAARCDISPQEVYQQWAAAVYSGRGDLNKDPLLSAFFSSPGSDSGSRRRLAEALLQTHDPMAMQSLLTLAAVPAADPNAMPPEYFDGRWFRSPAEQALLDDAWLLARCQWGVRCDGQSTTALRLCGERGWCGENVEDAIRQGRATRQEDMHAVQLLADQLGAAVAAKRVDRFVPPDRSQP